MHIEPGIYMIYETPFFKRTPYHLPVLGSRRGCDFLPFYPWLVQNHLVKRFTNILWCFSQNKMMHIQLIDMLQQYWCLISNVSSTLASWLIILISCWRTALSNGQPTVSFF